MSSQDQIDGGYFEGVFTVDCLPRNVGNLTWTDDGLEISLNTLQAVGWSGSNFVVFL